METQNGISSDEKIPNPQQRKIKLDEVLLQVGEFGHYQKRVYFLLCLPLILTAMHKLSWVFIGAKMDHRCQLPFEPEDATFQLPNQTMRMYFPPENEKALSWAKCERLDYNLSDHEKYIEIGIPETKRIGCERQFIYDVTKYKSSAVKNYQLVCDREIMRSHANALFDVGVFIGSFVSGSLSDRFGRRPTFFLCLVIQLIFGILGGFAPDYYTFVIARMFVGLSSSSAFLVAFVIAMEMVGPSYRVVTGVGCQLFFTAGYMFTALFAYFIRDGKLLQIAISSLGLFFMIYYWIIPESIRWLLARGRNSEAITIIRKVAKENKVELKEEIFEGLSEEPQKKSANVFQVFRYRRLGFRAVIIFFNWIVNSFVYYGLALNTSNLGGNDYLNFFIAAAVEVPAYGFLIFTLNRLGRKVVLCGSMLAGGIAMSICAFVPDNKAWLLITFSMIGKCCITASYAVIYIVTAEIFPTVVRNAGVGTSSMFARIGSIFSNYVIALTAIWKPLPLIIFGGLSITAALLALLIPETLGKRLPETFEEGNEFGTSAYEDTRRESEKAPPSDTSNGKVEVVL